MLYADRSGKKQDRFSRTKISPQGYGIVIVTAKFCNLKAGIGFAFRIHIPLMPCHHPSNARELSPLVLT